MAEESKAAEEKTVKLVSQEGESFDVAVSVARLSEFIKVIIDDSAQQEDDEAQEVPLTNVKAQALARVIEFCKHYQEERMTEIEKPLTSTNLSDLVQEWYVNFVTVEQEVLFELILAANYLEIKPLLDLTCATIGTMIKGKTTEQIREDFHIVNDFSPEELAQIKEEEKWCAEP